MLKSEHFADIFRPTKREHLIGETQLACWDALVKSYNEGKIKNKILFTGDTGTGKTKWQPEKGCALLALPSLS